MTRCLCYHNTVLSPSACPRVSHVMTSTWPGLRNNNIKCLLSLSRKTNLIIPSANKSLASNMVLIFRLSLSKVNTRVVSQLGNAEHSRVFISRPVLRKFHHRQCLSVSQTRVVQEISPSWWCLWSSPDHRQVISSPGPPGHKYYRVIVAEINYHRLREWDGRIFFCFNWCPETRNYNWYKFQDLIIPLPIPTIGRRGVAGGEQRDLSRNVLTGEVDHEIFNLEIVAVVISQILSHERHVGTFPDSVTGSLPWYRSWCHDVWSMTTASRNLILISTDSTGKGLNGENI